MEIFKVGGSYCTQLSNIKWLIHKIKKLNQEKPTSGIGHLKTFYCKLSVGI